MSVIVSGMIFFVYFCGLIFSVILVCCIVGLFDLWESGFGNLGVMNVLWIGGKGVVVVVFIFDIFKGMLFVWGVYVLGVIFFWFGFIVIVVCLGYIWLVFFGFKGGKGVVIVFGVIVFIGWDLIGVMVGIWLLMVLLSGYLLLGVIVSVLIVLFYVWWFKL